MWFSKGNAAPKLSEELLERIWDLNGRIKQLEGNLDERLDELSRRYRRAEQSENRLDAKKAATPCEDDEKVRRVHPALQARQKRELSLNSRTKEPV